MTHGHARSRGRKDMADTAGERLPNSRANGTCAPRDGKPIDTVPEGRAGLPRHDAAAAAWPPEAFPADGRRAPQADFDSGDAASRSGLSAVRYYLVRIVHPGHRVRAQWAGKVLFLDAGKGKLRMRPDGCHLHRRPAPGTGRSIRGARFSLQPGLQLGEAAFESGQSHGDITKLVPERNSAEKFSYVVNRTHATSSRIRQRKQPSILWVSDDCNAPGQRILRVNANTAIISCIVQFYRVIRASGSSSPCVRHPAGTTAASLSCSLMWGRRPGVLSYGAAVGLRNTADRSGDGSRTVCVLGASCAGTAARHLRTDLIARIPSPRHPANTKLSAFDRQMCRAGHTSGGHGILTGSKGGRRRFRQEPSRETKTACPPASGRQCRTGSRRTGVRRE